MFRRGILILLACVFCLKAEASYDHYFTWKEKPSDAELKACIAEMRRIAEARKDILAGRNGPGSPIILDATHLDLNGRGDDEYEPFIFPGKPGFNFCTTAGKPYDAVVTACLIAARDHFPPGVLAISSDGSWEDWQEGAKLYSSVLGRPARNPIGGSVLQGDAFNPTKAGIVIIWACAALMIVELIACLVITWQIFAECLKRLREFRDGGRESSSVKRERLQLKKERQGVRAETAALLKRLNARSKYE
jgi:hypothetical protein